MQTIDLDDLSSVRGGFLAGLLGAAGPILNGVASIIGAAKSGKGGGGSGGGGSAAVAAAAPTGPAPAPAYEDPLVSVTVGQLPPR